MHTVAPLGYLLGDEGSGVHIGKAISKAALRGKFRSGLEKKFLLFCNRDKDEILERIYREPNPKKFLAELSRFALENIEEPEISRIVHDCFDEYLQAFLLPYQPDGTCAISFTGSIAFYFKIQLDTLLNEHGYRLNSVLQSPIDGLVAYHNS